VELVLAESTAIVRAVPNILITRHRTGHVMANAGVDRSNVGPDGAEVVLLLPADSDASAERLRAALGAHWPAPPAVLISDSFGRPWRQGVTNVAIGAAGLPTLVDRRGDLDRDFRPLQVTQVAFGDLIASACGLAMGEGAENVPAVLVRGLHWDEADRPAAALVRPPDEDLFR
jgi:coenzyme F420-0:L-glutamate ligase/coenzyme F420-1:gamma-L-glutamate ligase